MSLTINYVICVICNQRIICYLLFFISVILSVLSNKTNLILGYSSPLNPVHRASLRLYAWEASYILCLYGKLLLYSVTGVIVPIFLMKVRTIMDLQLECRGYSGCLGGLDANRALEVQLPWKNLDNYEYCCHLCRAVLWTFLKFS